MGKIFTWEEIVNRRIPKIESFKITERSLETELTNCQGVIGAIKVGSIVWDLHTVLSDIDCVIVYEKSKRSAVMKVLNSCKYKANQLFVPLELIPVDHISAKKGNHHLINTFLDGLSLFAKNGAIIKRNPLDLITVNQLTRVQETWVYITNKTRKIEKGMSAIESIGEAELTDFCTRVLNPPLHTARKVLRCLGVSFENGDTKKHVVEEYKKIAPKKLVEILVEIIALNDRYFDQLNIQLTNPDKKKYTDLLLSITRKSWKVKYFLEGNLELMKEQGCI